MFYTGVLLLGQFKTVVLWPDFVSFQVNSSSPFPEAKQGRHFSSESTYSHSSAEDSRQDVAGSTHSSGCRPPYRERRSWQDLIETPLTSSGLHFLQTVPPDAEYMSGRPGMSPDRRRQATLPVQRRHNYEQDGPFPLVECQRGHSSHSRPQKQRSQSLPRNRDVRGKGCVKSIEEADDTLEEKVPIRRHNSFCAEGELLEMFWSSLQPLKARAILSLFSARILRSNCYVGRLMNHYTGVCTWNAWMRGWEHSVGADQNVHVLSKHKREGCAAGLLYPAFAALLAGFRAFI